MKLLLNNTEYNILGNPTPNSFTVVGSTEKEALRVRPELTVANLASFIYIESELLKSVIENKKYIGGYAINVVSDTEVHATFNLVDISSIEIELSNTNQTVNTVQAQIEYLSMMMEV